MTGDDNSGQDKFQSRQITSLKTAVAIGSTVTVGLSVFLLVGEVYRTTGEQAPAAYALTIFAFLLVILAIAERAGATPGKNGLFSLSRSSHSITISYGTGWVLFGGILFLTAIFAWEGGIALQRVLIQLFEFTVDGRLISALILLLVLPRLLSRSEAPWRKRTFLAYAAIAVLFILLIAAWRTPLEPSSAYVYLPSSEIIAIAPLLLLTLWSLQFVLDHRDELRKPGRSILSALLIPVIIGALLGAIVAWVLLQYPSLTFNDNLPLVALAEQIHPFLALLILLGMVIFAFIGVNESLSSALKLTSAMAHDGFLQPRISLRGRSIDLPNVALSLITAAALIVIFLAKSLDMASISSICLLLAITLINAQDIFHSKPRLPQKRKLRMPLHPLVPFLAVAISLTGIFIQPFDALLLTFTWIIGGVLLFILYARAGAVHKRQEKDMLGTTAVPLRKTSYRILTAISDPATAPSLIRLSLQLTAARGGKLILLHIIPAQERDKESEQRAQEAHHRLTEAIDALELSPEITIVPQIRIAPTAADGILTTMWEEQIDSVILGWPGTNDNSGDKDDITDRVVRQAQAEVIVLHGSWPQNPCRLLVPTISEGHSAAALSLAKSLRQDDENCSVVAMQPFSSESNQNAEIQARQQLDRTLAKLDDATGIERQVISAATSKEGIINQADQYDCLLLGLSDEGFLAPTIFAGVGVGVAEVISQPTLLVASRENAVRYWLRRSWDQLTSIVPTLTNRQQSTVSTAMRLNARESVDYHVLISLATAIAFLGLMQNSAAVIIGAMLVAPLMNPILAMAHGIVKGRLKMLREAATTTLNGVVIAVTIGVILTFVLLAMGYPLAPTSEILARTQPNLLDLLIALASGAVAAYAISRSEVAGALPGVAIAAALVPPLAVVGYGLGTAQLDIAGGSMLLFLTNLAAIVFAAAIIFLLLGFRPPAQVGRDDQARFGMKIAIISLLIISIPLVLTTRASGLQASRDATITTIMDSYWPPSQAQVNDIEITNTRGNELTVQATIFDYAGVVTENSLATLQQSLSNSTGENVSLITQIINARQEKYDNSSSAQQLTLTPTPTPPMTPSPSAAPTREVLLPVLPSHTPQPASTETPAIINTPELTATASVTATLTTSPQESPTPTAEFQPSTTPKQSN